MKKSVLFFDIDGTLLSEKTGKIPESAVQALQEAQRRGHMLFINTGRTKCSVPDEIRSYPFDGFLCGCGTGIYCHGEELFTSSLSRERGRELIAMADACGIGAVAEGQEDIYFPEKPGRFKVLEMMREHFKTRRMGIEHTLESGGFVYDKLFVFADGQSRMQRFLDFLGEDMEAMDRGGGAWEIIQKGYSKATACRFILDRFGFTLDDAYVFGDSSNDLAMFEFADHAVAMGCHDPVLDPHAEYVTAEVEQDGIARALEHYGLI